MSEEKNNKPLIIEGKSKKQLLKAFSNISDGLVFIESKGILQLKYLRATITQILELLQTNNPDASKLIEILTEAYKKAKDNESV